MGDLLKSLEREVSIAVKLDVSGESNLMLVVGGVWFFHIIQGKLLSK